MKIVSIRLYKVVPEKEAPSLANRNTEAAAYRYTQSTSGLRSLWMGPGQAPYAIEILTDEGVTGFAVNYGGSAAACLVIAKHFSRFLGGRSTY